MDNHDERRRQFLRSAATAGCALAVPALLVGCDQQQANEPPGPVVPDVAQEDVGKASQEKVKYQNQPNGEQMCARCVQFIADRQRCRIVAARSIRRAGASPSSARPAAAEAD